MAGKEGIFVILDINQSMKTKYNETMTRFDFGLESVRHLVRQKLLFNPKDQIGIILQGTEESENLQSLPSISIFKPLDFPTLNLFQALNLLDTVNAQGDLFDSIEVALEEFIRIYKKLKWNKKIYIITDGESKCENDTKRISHIAKALKSNDIKVNIITVGFFNEAEDENEPGEEDEDTKRESRCQQETKAAIKKLMVECDNVKVFTAKMANHIYHQFRKKKINPVTKFRGPLVLTPNLFLDVAVYTKTAIQNLPSLKKYSLATEYSEDVKANGIANERLYYVHDDPDQNPLSDEYRTKAYYYGTNLVPISATDEVLFKNQENKSLKAIGFTDNFKVPRHYFMSGVDIVIPNPQSEKDVRAFASIVSEMIKGNKVLICRYVYRNNSEPKLVVLSPHIGKKGACLYLNTLPTIEDIRDYQFDSLKECTMVQEQVVSKFIDSLSLERGNEEGEVEEVEEVLKPSETYNPVLQYFYQCLEHKALKNNTSLPCLDETISEYMKPDKNLFEKSQFAAFLPKMFEIKEKEQKNDKKKRVFWRDIINTEIEENTGISDKKLEEKLEKNKEEAKKTLSATRPIEDFKEMLSFKYEDLTINAMQQLKDIIIKFIVESFKGSYYIRAMECLKVLRDSSIEEDEVELFNTFMEDLKKNFPKEKFLDFWKLIVDNRITLISSKENVKSVFSEKECSDWIEGMMRKEVITSSLKDFDDLIADID